SRTSVGSRGCTRRLSLVARSSSRAGRTLVGAYTSAERVMLTAVVTRCAIWVARGPSSMLKKTCSHAPRLTSIKPARSRKERLNSPRRNRDLFLVLGLCGGDMEENLLNHTCRKSVSAIGY